MFLRQHFTLLSIFILSLFVFGCNSESAPGESSSAPASAAKASRVKPAPSLAPLKAGDDIVVLETAYGPIRLRLYDDVAPQHVAAFKKLVNEKFFDGTGFHRAIPGGIIQGGDPNTRSSDKSTWGMGTPDQPTIPAEFNSRPFVRGTLGAARKGNDVNSATSQFFICFKRFEEWDGNYTVFGEVIDTQSLSNAEIISNAPSDPSTQLLSDKALIRRAYLEKYAPKN